MYCCIVYVCQNIVEVLPRPRPKCGPRAGAGRGELGGGARGAAIRVPPPEAGGHADQSCRSRSSSGPYIIQGSLHYIDFYGSLIPSSHVDI